MKNLSTLYLLLMLLFLSSCASIVSKSSYPLTINTNPSRVSVLVKDNNGELVYQGESPSTVLLDASSGFFKKAQYTVHVSQRGYKTQTLPVEFKIDGMYFGNLLLGGVIGMLIVDPATGAMYKLKEDQMDITLPDLNASADSPVLKVYDLAKLPIEFRDTLIEIEP